MELWTLQVKKYKSHIFWWTFRVPFRQQFLSVLNHDILILFCPENCRVVLLLGYALSDYPSKIKNDPRRKIFFLI